MYIVQAVDGALLQLGVQGENKARAVAFDFSAWAAEFGPGAVQLIFLRQETEIPYPATLTVDEAHALWVLTEADTAVAGYGRCELQYVVGETVVKSAVWKTYIAQSLGAHGEEPPAPFESWLEQLHATAAQTEENAQAAEAAADRAEAAASHPPRINGVLGVWQVWSEAEGAYIDTVFPVRGPQGESGPAGERGPAGPAGEAGSDGADGKDATINGVNTLEMVAGENINLTQEGNRLTISATGGGMTKWLLQYDGSAITLDGTAVTFQQVYDHLMGGTGFAVLVYDDCAYHPNKVNTEEIIFSAVYPTGGYIQDKRITYLHGGAVTTTFGEAEKTSSRVSGIADADKASTTKYPSVKAVVDYVATHGGGGGGGEAPTGTIISYMGNSAPAGYLTCDGSTVSLTDYAALAAHIAAEFGAANYFGGDGTATFAVPDLRGEFLRGSGANSHTDSGSGGEVGGHQAATRHIWLGTGGNGNIIYSRTPDLRAQNLDWKSPSIANNFAAASMTTGNYAMYQFMSTRPTNTSVLYCIKY